MSIFNAFFRRSSLSGLAKLDDCRLSDIGLNRYDLFEAAGKGRHSVAFLNERRSERASFWLK